MDRGILDFFVLFLLSRSITNYKTYIVVGMSFSRFVAIFIFYIFPLICDVFGPIFKLFFSQINLI